MIKSYRIRTIGLFLFTVFLISGMARYAAAQGNIVTIDEHNRLILNGAPFFPLGLYLWWDGQQPYPDTDELDAIAASDFDTLMHYNTAFASDTENSAFLAALPSRGLKLIFSLYAKGCNRGPPYDPEPVNTVCEMEIPFPTIGEFETYTEQKVTGFKDHPAIIAWYLNDEICPVCLDWLVAGYNKIKQLDKLDSSHPVWSVHWNYSGPNSWLLQEAHTTDIVGVDPHTNHPNPITLTANMADAAIATGKPLWLVPGIANATLAEMRAMTYVAVNRGAKGLIYYRYSALDDTRWEQIKEIAREIDQHQLRSVFLSTSQTSDNDVTCNNGDIDFKLMWDGGTYYLFAVNTNNGNVTGVPFQINLVNKPTVFDTLFEVGRQVSVISGTVTDDFGPYEVHVYHWQGSFEVDSDGDGFTGEQGDCNDDDPDINPDADEVCDDAIDNNCDGDIDEGCDQDADGGGTGGDDSDGNGGGGGSCFIGTAGSVIY